jgi:hypothetical protein
MHPYLKAIHDPGCKLATTLVTSAAVPTASIAAHTSQLPPRVGQVSTAGPTPSVSKAQSNHSAPERAAGNTHSSPPSPLRRATGTGMENGGRGGPPIPSSQSPHVEAALPKLAPRAPPGPPGAGAVGQDQAAPRQMQSSMISPWKAGSLGLCVCVCMRARARLCGCSHARVGGGGGPGGEWGAVKYCTGKSQAAYPRY